MESALPREIIVKILSHLGTPQELAKCALLSHSFQGIVNDQDLWKELAIRKYGATVVEATKQLYASEEGQPDWKDMLRDDNRLGALPTLMKHVRGEVTDDQGEEVWGTVDLFAVQWDRVHHCVNFHIDAEGPEIMSFASLVITEGSHTTGALTEIYMVRAISWTGERTGGSKRGFLSFDESVLSDKFSIEFCYCGLPLASFRPGNLTTVDVYDRYTLAGPISDVEGEPDEVVSSFSRRSLFD